MFIAITRDDVKDARFSLQSMAEQVELTAFAATDKSTLRRRLTTAGWHEKDILILEVPDDFD